MGILRSNNDGRDDEEKFDNRSTQNSPLMSYVFDPELHRKLRSGYLTLEARDADLAHLVYWGLISCIR